MISSIGVFIARVAFNIKAVQLVNYITIINCQKTNTLSTDQYTQDKKNNKNTRHKTSKLCNNNSFPLKKQIYF